MTRSSARHVESKATPSRVQAKARARRESGYKRAVDALAAAEANVVLEIDHVEVELTRLDKVLWPADTRRELPRYTRRDYLRYLLRVGPHILTHVRDRPLTLVRQPDGVNGRRFVHFHYEATLPRFVETIDIYSEKVGRAEQYLLCNNLPTLLWLAHIGSLEFHVWHSRAAAGADAKGATTDYASSPEALERSPLNRPDYIVCDLDPYIYSGREEPGGQPELNAEAWARTKEVALALKRLLDATGLRSLVKTSGKTGLHILIPVVRTLPYDAARAFAQTLGRHLMREHPQIITMQARVSERTGKIFFDAGMNARVKTLVAPYSTRGIPGAPVAMPLHWDELEDAHPLDYTMTTAPERLARVGDIWADLVDRKQDVARILAS